jgi:hypothetical protein
VITLYPVWTDRLALHSITLQDGLGSLTAVLAFATVFYAPGYLLAHSTNLFSFRPKPFADRSLWAIATSFSLTPILAYGIGRTLGLTPLCWLLAASALATLVLLLRRQNSHPHWPARDRRLTLLLATGWTLFVLLMLVDLQLGHRLYFSVVMADQSYRIAFTDAVLRTGVPPDNPLYFAGTAAPMRYYYFWYVLCAAVAKLAHVSAQQAFIASSVWAGFGLLATVKLFATNFFRWSRRTTCIALGLLAVMGADLIPSLGNAILQPTLNGDIEWWSVDPIDAWPDSLLWVPHHVASVLCCTFAFLLLWKARNPTTPRARNTAVALAGIAFASAFGLSIYVAFGFALLMLAWLLRLASLRDPSRWTTCRQTAAAALLAAALLTPFLIELSGVLNPHLPAAANAPPSPTAHPFVLSVRQMIDSGLLTGLPIFSALNHSHPQLLDQTLRLLLLPAGLAMELGLYGFLLILLLRLKRRRTLPPNDARDTALFLTLSGLLLTMFLSSSVITNNDFGYRAVMLPQFFLTLLSAEILSAWFPPRTSAANTPPFPIPPTPTRRRLTIALLALGIAGSVYAAVLLRVWLPIEARYHRKGYEQLPTDAFQLREAFAVLHRIASPAAVVAFRAPAYELDRDDAVMTPTDFYQRMIVQNTARQFLNAEQKCAIQFGGDPNRCHAIQQATTTLYALPAPSPDAARAFCARFGAQYLLIGHHDPAWQSPTGWPANLPIVAAEPSFNILRCAETPSTR